MSNRESAGRSAGFTLIEVLVSMAVLVVLILALTRTFVEATAITKRGSTMLMRNSTAETAMETLMQDAEGMVVNDRLACYVEADTADDPADATTFGYGFGFDDVWFISTSGDQDDDMPYEYFHFFVDEVIATNANGVPYKRFDLMKERMIFSVADDDARDPNRYYALDPAYQQWWEKGKDIPFTVWDRQVLADNVVRFDIYCLGWDGRGWMAGTSAGLHEFDSTVGPNIPGLSAAEKEKYRNVPPAAFDIYLQVTSPEVAQESGPALLPGVDDATQLKAREKMIRDSSSIFGRAVPLTGAARYNISVVYGTNNTSYYQP